MTARRWRCVVLSAESVMPRSPTTVSYMGKAFDVGIKLAISAAGGPG